MPIAALRAQCSIFKQVCTETKLTNAGNVLCFFYKPSEIENI